MFSFFILIPQKDAVPVTNLKTNKFRSLRNLGQLKMQQETFMTIFKAQYIRYIH